MSDLLISTAQVIFVVAAVPIILDRKVVVKTLISRSFTAAYGILALGFALIPSPLSCAVAVIGAVAWLFISLRRTVAGL